MSRVFCEQGVTVVELGPRYDSLDLKVMDQFGRTMVRAAEEADPPLLLLDLSSTLYIGSAFVEVLLQAWKRIEGRQGRMALCGVGQFCLEVLHTTRLDALWGVFATRQEAAAALTSP